MITGFNTNVAYKAKVFHVQTEDCPKQSQIRTVVFDSGMVVASVDCAYSELTGVESPQDRHLSRRLESQHWELVKRLKETGSLSEPEPEPKSEVEPEVEVVLTDLDQCIEEAQPTSQTLAGLDQALKVSEAPPAVAVPSRKRRAFKAWPALVAVVLLAFGWIAHSLVDRVTEVSDKSANPHTEMTSGATPRAAPVESPTPASTKKTLAAEERTAPPIRRAEFAATLTAKPDASSPQASTTDLAGVPPVAAVSARSATPSPKPTTVRSEPRPAAALNTAPIELPAELPVASPADQQPEATETAPTASPPIEDTELPEDPTPAIVAQPPTPKVDWTGKLVPLADVDTTPSTIKRDLPRYTKRAKRKKQQGSVGLRLLIDETGAVSRVDLLESIPDSDLNEATIDRARLWRFRPATKEGYPVQVWKPLTIDFSIVSGFARVLVKDTGGS